MNSDIHKLVFQMEKANCSFVLSISYPLEVTAARPFSDAQEIASLIDHTLLKADAAETDILSLCEQALQYHFAAVCVNPCWVPLVHSKLQGSGVRTCSVVGFPLGAHRTRIKSQEARLATDDGASEVDMVINVGALRSGQLDLVARELQEVSATAHAGGAILKVIIETSILTDEQKVLACKLAKEAGADFVKTSTGFSGAGATEADVSLMRATVGPQMGVKASGGVRTLEAVAGMVHAGANRIGTSSGVQILAEFQTPWQASQPGTPVMGEMAVPTDAFATTTEIRFKERAELLDFLLEVSTLTAETLDLDRLIINVAEIIKDVIPYELFAILLYNEKNRVLRMRHSIGHRDEVAKNLTIGLGEGLPVMRRARVNPFWLNDVRKDHDI